MADITVPLNRVGVIRLRQIDIAGSETQNQASQVEWIVAAGSVGYFSLVVSADGLTAEIHPLAEGSGHCAVTLTDDISIGQKSYYVDIVANTSDPGPVGNSVRFVGAEFAVVKSIGVI
jgi:hypothetical protein